MGDGKRGLRMDPLDRFPTWAILLPWATMVFLTSLALSAFLYPEFWQSWGCQP